MDTSFLQNENQVFDSQGNRLIMCFYCGKIDKTNKFVFYGGKDTMNTGVCCDCFKEKEREDNGIQKSL